jgi:ABC-2 type transport system permease protein
MNLEQFRAILWLRWRLTRNQLTRGGGLNAAIASLAGVILVMIALGAGLGATLIGAIALKHASVTKVMFVWDGVTLFVLFISLIAVATELQRSESVDLTRLLHLPIGLRQVFIFNYLVSLVSMGPVLALAIMLGLAAGLVISQGPRFLLAIPLVVMFVFMVTAWVYCLRGWLLSLMVNPRRRRSIIMWLTLGVILLGQSPQLINVAYQRKARRDRETRRAAPPQSAGPQTAAPRAAATTDDPKGEYFAIVAAQVHPWVPVLWLPNGARGLAAGEVWPAVWGGAAMCALGWLGLGRAYRATLRFYRAEERAQPAKLNQAPVEKGRPARNWVEIRLPWVSEDTAALALAQCRSMTRAPEVRMMLAMGLFAAIILPAMLLWRGGSAVNFPEAAKPFIGTGAVLMILFMLVQIACNQFGWDRDGFRSLVLLPTPRERLLLGKNLALLPVAAAIALVPLAGVSVWAKLPALIVLANVLQFAAAFLLFCALGNLASILVPYRIAAGSLKPSKQSWQTSLLLMLVHVSFPLVASPVFLPPLLGFGVERLGWLPAAPVHLVSAGVMVVAFAALYWLTLPAMGRLLQRRETRILRAVTEVIE